ncbi:hypothetical protein PRN20_03390 [Devosia sp. ZB163]|uniref:hypothetical protein n=1 Tax=Devosia sp. ZB163 TaxID=3025938 RepID=UPI00235F5C32|nr:hypothetical protein [Devosia sp. ZB163]MDC9822767.1 hypothetical protein [Devosia sp. ZB163]
MSRLKTHPEVPFVGRSGGCGLRLLIGIAAASADKGSIVLANHHFAGSADGMDLEQRLRDVQSDYANLLHGRLLSCGPRHTATWHIAMPAEEPSTASLADTLD